MLEVVELEDLEDLGLDRGNRHADDEDDRARSAFRVCSVACPSPTDLDRVLARRRSVEALFERASHWSCVWTSTFEAVAFWIELRRFESSVGDE